MKKIALLALLMIALSSCHSTKNLVVAKSETTKIDLPSLKTSVDSLLSNAPDNLSLASVDLTPINLNVEYELPRIMGSRARRIIDHAFAFDGVRYKRGGTTTEGMDCSGLVVTTFDRENIPLPRVSREIARVGSLIDLKEVAEGDLLFFATRKNSKMISHVGIVTNARNGYVEFIHASTSNGVIVSNLTEKFWNSTFIQARRVI